MIIKCFGPRAICVSSSPTPTGADASLRLARRRYDVSLRRFIGMISSHAMVSTHGIEYVRHGEHAEHDGEDDQGEEVGDRRPSS